jgi:formylmethanofuran:tetrahydromethanopterin formyltransferase
VEDGKNRSAALGQPSKLVKYLKLTTEALALGAAVLGLATDIIEHFQKPPATPDERTRAGTALLTLATLRAAPNIIRSVRRLAARIEQL